MSESVLASLDASTSEADNGTTLGAEESGAPGSGAASVPARDGGGDAGVSKAASGQGGGNDGGTANSGEGKDTKLVPLAALHEAREQAKQLKSQIAELEKRKYLSDEDAELLQELKAKRAEAQQPKRPEFVEDPKGYIDTAEKEVREALKELREANAQRSQADERQQQHQQLMGTIAHHEHTFVAANPDYQEALAHTRGVRANQLRMMFPDATDQQIQQQIGREELGGAQQILARGGNPAEFAYNYAKTLGYVKKQAAAAVTNGAAIEHSKGEKPDKDAVRSLGGGGGAEPDDAPADPMPEFSAALKERFARKRK